MLFRKEKHMKEKIEKRLEEYADALVAKDDLVAEDVNFLVFMLNRYEMKEANAALADEKKKSNEEWRKRMNAMIEGVS